MRIYLLHHSHTDFGYTHHPVTVFGLQRDYLRQAMHLAEKYADGAPGERFRWTVETLATLDDFLRYARTGEIDLLKRLHEEGLIDFNGLYANWFPLADVSILQETFHLLERIRNEYGFRIEYGLNCDVTGLSWGLPDLMLDYGLKGLGMAVNRTMARDPQPRPRGFWWQTPSRRRLLTWHGEHYGLGQHFGIPRVKTSAGWVVDLDASRKKLNEYLADLERAKYPYEFCLFQITSTFLYDNGPPHEELVQFVREWNRRGWQPELYLTGLEEFFSRLEQQTDLPVLNGDWTDYWTQGIASSLTESALNRQNHARWFAVRALETGLGIIPDPIDYENAWRCLAMFDEHTWGSAESVTHPWAPATKGTLFWRYSLAYEASARITRLGQLALRALSARIPQNSVEHAVLFNPLPWPRTIALYLPRLNSTSWALAKLEYVQESAGAFSADPHLTDYGMISLPACGYALAPLRLAGPVSATPQFDLGGMADVKQPELVPQIAPGLLPCQRVVEWEGGIENSFYRLEFNPDTGAIIHLVSKSNGREWVDDSTDWQLGQYVYETNHSPRGRADMQTTMQSQPDFDRQPLLQPVRQGVERVVERSFVPGVGKARLVQKLLAPGVREIWMQVILYEDQPWIDLIYDIFKLEVTEPESVYITFPFALHQPKAHFDTTGAIVLAEEEQLPFANRDFYHIQSWVDLSDDERGATLISPDAPLVHLGGFTNHRYQPHLDLQQQPCLVSWVMNNHWMTAFPVSQSGWTRSSYRLELHESPFNPVKAARLAAEMTCPALIGALRDRPVGLEEPVRQSAPDIPERASFLLVEPAQVQLVGYGSGLSAGETGMTLQELANSSTNFRLSFPTRNIQQAKVRLPANPSGEWQELVVKNGVVEGVIGARQILEVRVIFL